jgi:hypothetical protein
MGARQNSSIFSEPLRLSIVRLGMNLEQRKPLQPELNALLESLNRLPPGAVAAASREITSLARLRPRRSAMASMTERLPQASDHHLLQATPGLEYAFLLHGDGRLREAALELMKGGAPSAFIFAVIGARLNDWAPAVRNAARRCASRVFPATDPAIIAEAAIAMLGRIRDWRRWGEEASALGAAFARRDTQRCLADRFASGKTGPLGTILGYALEREGMDQYLPDLAANASLPTVRAVALRSLIERRATWRIGYARQWVDKRFGISRRVPVLGERQIIGSPPLELLIARGARDRSALVRRIAADGLINHRLALANIDPIVETLARDRNVSVRERAEFIIRRNAVDDRSPS